MTRSLFDDIKGGCDKIMTPAVFDVNAVEGERLPDRLMSTVINNRHFAVIEPDARIRGAMATGLQRGTVLGEAVRSAVQFKSFPMNFMMTHMMHALTQGDMGNCAYRTSQMFFIMTLAGAATVQMQSLIAGRDPQDMGTGGIWTESMIRGGGLGMLGYFDSFVSRGGEGITQLLAGPAPARSRTLSLVRYVHGNRGCELHRPCWFRLVDFLATDQRCENRIGGNNASRSTIYRLRELIRRQPVGCEHRECSGGAFYKRGATTPFSPRRCSGYGKLR